ILPLASVTGVWGIAFVVMLINVLVLEAVLAMDRWGRAVAVGVAAVVLFAPALIPLPPANGPRVGVAVVQGNVPRALASDLLLRGDTVETNEISLHATLAADPPQLAVWPENSLDEDPRRDPRLANAISTVIRGVGAPTIVGGVGQVEGRIYNTAFDYSANGRIVGTYDKVHLVPFGEYIPFGSLFAWTQQYRRGNADFTAGDRIVVFRTAGTTVGTPICFESAFPDLFRRFVAMGARLMVVTTNDSSFLRSPASREHVDFAQLRAVETGRWVVQAAVSGESAVVDPRGHVVARTGLFTREVLRFDVPTSDARTLYVRLGDWFPWASGIACCFGLLVFAVRRRRPVAPPAGERGAEVPGRFPAPVAGGAEPRTLVILPTYEERGTIETVVREVLDVAPHVDVLVVDDASPDGTGDLVESMAAREPRVRLLRRPGKLGLASAYVTGFSRAVDEGYDVAVEMDADLSHRPQDLPRLLEGALRYDLTVGSRYVEGGAVSNWSRTRLMISRAGNAYARTMLGLSIRDATSGFRAFRRELLEWLLPRGVHSDGYGFQIELAYRASRGGFRVGEVPITFRERELGRSKFSRRIVVEALVKVARWGFEDRVLRRGGRSSARV
ncbi:MAG TPA: apolipoprotein N-acyltransferase, partial [Gemmatimonadales bacterium]